MDLACTGNEQALNASGSYAALKTPRLAIQQPGMVMLVCASAKARNSVCYCITCSLIQFVLTKAAWQSCMGFTCNAQGWMARAQPAAHELARSLLMSHMQPLPAGCACSSPQGAADPGLPLVAPVEWKARAALVASSMACR